MSRVGFKYSCQSSHLYIMPVKRGYKIDGRDQTSEEKQQVFLGILFTILDLEKYCELDVRGEK